MITSLTLLVIGLALIGIALRIIPEGPVGGGLGMLLGGSGILFIISIFV